jgi:uncharacterized membrane protein YqhA
MVQIFLAFRYIMLIAVLGAVLGAMVMFWQGATNLIGAIWSLVTPGSGKSVTASVMHATDAILFGVVLAVFAYAIAFGFVVGLSPEASERLPGWMRVESLSNLKQSLIEVILVYMVVDVATDWTESDPLQDWSSLVKPMSIVLIAGASRLLNRSSRT